MRGISCIVLILLAAVSIQAVRQQPVVSATAVVEASTSIVRDFTQEPVTSIPDSVRANAKAVVVFPKLQHEGPVYYGTGIISLRSEDRADSWSMPGVVTLKRVVLPAAGLAADDLMLVVMSRKGVFYVSQDAVESDKQPFIPPGPIGRETEVLMKVDILSYTRFGPVIAGATLKELSLAADKGANEKLYGRGYSTREILFERPATLPEAVGAWREAVGQLLSGKTE